jgi:hypothetical protein
MKSVVVLICGFLAVQSVLAQNVIHVRDSDWVILRLEHAPQGVDAKLIPPSGDPRPFNRAFSNTDVPLSPSLDVGRNTLNLLAFNGNWGEPNKIWEVTGNVGILHQSGAFHSLAKVYGKPNAPATPGLHHIPPDFVIEVRKAQ